MVLNATVKSIIQNGFIIIWVSRLAKVKKIVKNVRLNGNLFIDIFSIQIMFNLIWNGYTQAILSK